MSLFSLFNFKRRSSEMDEERARQLGDQLVRDMKVGWPPGLRLKVSNKDALTPEGRAALLPGDVLVVTDPD